MILPGEVAPAHRHVSSAIRFVLDGEGAYTAVEGEKAFMSPGDFVITANWAPHDHGNPSKKPMLWLDVLDFPAVNFFEASFAAYFDDKMQNTTRADGDSEAFYASGVLPDGAPTKLNRSPVINYTYARTRPILDRLKKSGDIDRRHGARVHYVNPVNGGPVLPTMGASLALFPKGFKGEPYRATDGTILVCTEGGGTTKVEDTVLEWGPNDVFVIPPWKRYTHQVGKDSVLFSISDRPAQEALGIWREERNLSHSFPMSSPRKRGPIRCALAMEHGVWIPALASLGRDDSPYLFRRLLPDTALPHQRHLLFDHVALVVGVLAGNGVQVAVLRIDRLLVDDLRELGAHVLQPIGNLRRLAMVSQRLDVDHAGYES
jgi:gentisate 1,2-dioxygenase